MLSFRKLSVGKVFLKESLFSYTGPQWPCSSPKALVVLFHGYGSNGNNLLPLAEIFDLPRFFFWFPQGNERCESHQSGRQWFSLQGIESARDWTSETLLQRLEKASQLFIQSLQEGIGSFTGPIFVGGFSQGAALAYHVGLFGMPVAGILGFSGFYTLRQAPRFRPPLFWCHGDRDEVVPFAKMEEAEVSFAQYGLSFTKCVIPNGGHSIDNRGIQQARLFLHDSSNPTFRSHL